MLSKNSLNIAAKMDNPKNRLLQRYKQDIEHNDLYQNPESNIYSG